MRRSCQAGSACFLHPLLITSEPAAGFWLYIYSSYAEHPTPRPMLRRLRLLVPVLLIALAALPGRAQTFTYSTALALPDTCSNLCADLAVLGLPALTSDSFGLASVCINITHTYDSDLTIILKTPTGQEILLVNRSGGDGDNFTNTCFAEDAVGLVVNGSAPFPGVWRPVGDLNTANNGLNPNGVWRLCVTDNAAQDFGILNSFQLTFSRNPPTSPPPPPTPCSFSNIGACGCPDGSDTCDLLPDMTASAGVMTQHTEYQGSLRISNGTPNIGYGPLEIHGTGECYCDTVRLDSCTAPCPPGMLKEKVIQTIYHKMGDSLTTYTRPAGYMAYHPSHGHVHVENWSQFSIRNRTPDPNPLHWPIVATGHKVSFCLVNLADCIFGNGYCANDSGRILDQNTMPNAGLGTVTGCQRDQGIWPGKLDIYDQTLDGQDIPLDSVCNGNYWVVSQTDPNNIFKESNDTNNVAIAPLAITRQALPPATPITLSMRSAYQATLSANIPLGQRFTWNFGDGQVDSTTNPVFHDYATPGTYIVRLTVHYKCGDRFSERSILVTATKPLLTPAELGLAAEPNPAPGGRFTIRYRKPTTAPVSLRILDLAGHTLQTLEAEAAPGQHSLPMDAQLPAGVYLIHYTTAYGSATVRMMVQ